MAGRGRDNKGGLRKGVIFYEALRLGWGAILSWSNISAHYNPVEPAPGNLFWPDSARDMDVICIDLARQRS